VSERQDRAEVETTERVFELSETRKSLDSLNPPPPTAVPTAMAAMADTDGLMSDDPRSLLATPPTDADG
jgi:hypothetical protein